MKKRLLASLLTLVMLFGLLPSETQALEEGITTIAIMEADIENSDDATAISVAVSRLDISELASITRLKVITEGEAYLTPEDNVYIKENFTSLTYLDESNCKCSTRKLVQAYLEKSGLPDVEYQEFGGLAGFSSLQTLLIPEGAQIINSYGLEDRGGGVNATGLTTLNIPDGVLLFESGSFANNTALTADLAIPDSAIFIGNNAFGAGDTPIQCGTLTLGGSLRYIDNNGFKSRVFSGNLVIPNSVEKIGNWVFATGSFEGGTWTLGDGLEAIGSAAFKGICSGNTGTLMISEKLNRGLGSSAIANNTFLKVIFEEGITDINTSQVIAGSANLEEIILPSTLKHLTGNYVFGNCSALKTVSLPEGLETLGKGVFSDDDALTSIVLPSTLKEIGDSAFEDSGIVGVYIPKNVTSMGNRVFQDIPSGSVIYMDNNALLTIVNTTTSDWNKKYNATNTALAVTNSGSFAKDTTFTANNLATPTREGYTFGGWYTDSGFTSETVTSAAAGQTYYAKWISAITFDGNGATSGTMSVQEIPEGDTAALSANGFTRTGYTFDRWNTAADGSGDSYADQASAPTGNTTLYAQWTPNPYTISFSGGEGAGGATANVAATYDTPATLTANGFTRPGFKFVGWDTDSSADEVVYSDLSQAKNLTAQADGTVTLYAVWSEKAALTPDLSVQTKTYTGAEQAFAVEGCTAAYQHNGVAATPKNAGAYDVVISAEETDSTAAYRATIYAGLVITPAPLTVTAENKSIYVGDALPAFTYTVDGWQGGDRNLIIAPNLSCSAADSGTAGSYAITPGGADAGSNYTITYVDGALTISRRSGGGSGSSSYAVSVSDTKNGAVSVSPKNAGKGTAVTVTVKPDNGYELDELAVLDKNGAELKLTDRGDGRYTFTMPEGKVTVEAVFAKTGQSGIAFADVPADAYYAEAVEWAVRNGVTSGTAAAAFSPNASCTRAQMVTFLWRAAGAPKASGSNPFSDVDGDAYYYDAVLWAAANGVTSGTSATSFSPDAAVTRGQTVTFLHRAAGSPAADGSPFADVPADAYCADAVAWALAEGITSGTGDGTFSPNADCTRAQIVTFLYRSVQ